MAGQLKNLMQGLYYPAVTGTGTVLVLYRLTMHESVFSAAHDLALGYGIVFVLWFSASFVAISLVPVERYTGYEFLLDTIEVILTFCAFYFLGLFSTDSIREPNLRGVYGSAFVLGVAQALWRFCLPDSHDFRLWILRLTLLLTNGVGLARLHVYAWFNNLAFLVMVILVLVYVLVLRERSLNSSH